MKALRSFLLLLALGLLPPIVLHLKMEREVKWFTGGQILWFCSPALIIALFDILRSRYPKIFRIRYFVGVSLAFSAVVTFLLTKGLKGAPDGGGLAAGALIILLIGFAVVGVILFAVYLGVNRFSRFVGDDRILVKFLVPVVVVEIALLTYSVSSYRKMWVATSKCHWGNDHEQCLKAAILMLENGKYEKLVKNFTEICDYGSAQKKIQGAPADLIQLCYSVAKAYEKLGQPEEAKERIERGCQYDRPPVERCYGTEAEKDHLKIWAGICQRNKALVSDPKCIKAAMRIKALGENYSPK